MVTSSAHEATPRAVGEADVAAQRLEDPLAPLDRAGPAGDDGDHRDAVQALGDERQRRGAAGIADRAITSAAPRQRAIRPVRLSIAPFHSARACS